MPRPEDFLRGYRDRGTASWYGSEFNGRPTASGDRYDMDGLSAAHRLLPFGTYLLVTNLENGKSVRVRVNDRGPFVRDRVLDLSRGAATELGMLDTGIAQVEYRILETPAAPVRLVQYTVQVGTFAQQQNAARLQARLAASYPKVRIVPRETNQSTLLRVRVGDFERAEDAERMAKRLSKDLGFEVFVMRQDG